jgi:hypothetical protein
VKRYQVQIEVAGDSFVDACAAARDAVRPGAAFTVRESEPLAGGISWSVSVTGELHGRGGKLVEVMLTFDPARKRGTLMLFEDGAENTVTTIALQPYALRELLRGIGTWPSDQIARLATEEIVGRIK